MSKYIVVVLMLLMSATACHKDTQPEPMQLTVEEDSLVPYTTGADFAWTVDFPGKVSSVVRLSPNADMGDAQTFGSDTPTGDKSFTARATGLSAHTTYYYCYEAWNPGVSYTSEVKRFTTKDMGLPTVTTAEVTDITPTTATCSGDVIDDGGLAVTERGVCWSATDMEPTVADRHAASGTGTGSFTCSLTSLTANTTYYVRAYATNSAGTAYGNEVSFTTNDNLTLTVNGVTFTMKPVEGGTFRMGSEDSQAYSSEQPVHSVTLSSFYMGETEVTQALWEAVMGSNPSYFKGDNLPVECVSWNDIVNDFLPRLNQLTGRIFRLPTEAEWEYAARGGNKSNGTQYAGGGDIGSVAWYTDNSGSKTHAVKGKQPNELGLYDMSGNVWEWCEDWYGSYSSGSQTNPQGPSSGGYRVLRGGSWRDYARYCRVSLRNSSNPDCRYDDLGLRLCLPQ